VETQIFLAKTKIRESQCFNNKNQTRTSESEMPEGSVNNREYV